jgi:hypothetical protein
MGALLDSLGEIPHGAVLGVVTLGVLLVQVGVLAMASKRKLGLRPHVLAGATILAIPIVAGFVVHESRAMLLHGLTAAGDPSDKATEISRGVTGQMNAIPFALSSLGLAGAVWFVGLLQALSGQRGPARHGLVFLAFLAVGIGVVGVGGLRWSVALIKTFAGLAGVEPSLKPMLIEKALSETRAELELFARAARWLLVAVTIGCAIAAALLRVAPDERPRQRRQTLLALAALALAGALFLAARPMRAENALAWPPSAGGDYLPLLEPKTPDLDAPDEIQRAPVIQVFDDKLALDGAVTDAESLLDKLSTLRVNYQLLNPGSRFEGRAVLVVGRTAPMARVRVVLHDLREEDYAAPLFAFMKEEITVRPTFGPLRRVHGSGAKVALIKKKDEILGWEDRPAGTVVRLADFKEYGALAERLVALRRAGEAVVVDIGE